MPLRQPVFGKVRKIGERLRGLFKNKVEPVPKGSPGVASDSLEYGLMTTTTAITNVEYESVREGSDICVTHDVDHVRRSIPYRSRVPEPELCATTAARCRFPYCSLPLSDYSRPCPAAHQTELTLFLSHR